MEAMVHSLGRSRGVILVVDASFGFGLTTWAHDTAHAAVPGFRQFSRNPLKFALETTGVQTECW